MNKYQITFTFLLCILVGKLFNENVSLKNRVISLEQSRETLSWLAKEYAPIRDYAEKADAEIRYLRFRATATEIMHSEWVDILNAAWKYGLKYEIPHQIILAVIHRESNFKLSAASPVAYGLMQIHYSVWRDEFSLDFNRLLTDIDYNIMHGCIILRQYYDMCHDWGTALLLYNNGFHIRNWQYPQRVFDSKFYLGGKDGF